MFLPRFSGDGKPEYWIFRAELYFTYLGFDKNDWLPLPRFYLDGEALTWFDWLFRNKQFYDWNHFKEKLLLRFRQQSLASSVESLAGFDPISFASTVLPVSLESDLNNAKSEEVGESAVASDLSNGSPSPDAGQVFDNFSHRAEHIIPVSSRTDDDREMIAPVFNKNFVSEPEFYGNLSPSIGAGELHLVEDLKGNATTYEYEENSNTYVGQISIHRPFDPGEPIPPPISCALRQFDMLCPYADFSLQTKVSTTGLDDRKESNTEEENPWDNVALFDESPKRDTFGYLVPFPTQGQECNLPNFFSSNSKGCASEKKIQEVLRATIMDLCVWDLGIDFKFWAPIGCAANVQVIQLQGCSGKFCLISYSNSMTRLWDPGESWCVNSSSRRGAIRCLSFAYVSAQTEQIYSSSTHIFKGAMALVVVVFRARFVELIFVYSCNRQFVQHPVFGPNGTLKCSKLFKEMTSRKMGAQTVQPWSPRPLPKSSFFASLLNFLAQVVRSVEMAKALDLNGLIIIGRVDSDTNARLLFSLFSFKMQPATAALAFIDEILGTPLFDINTYVLAYYVKLSFDRASIDAKEEWGEKGIADYVSHIQKIILVANNASPGGGTTPCEPLKKNVSEGVNILMLVWPDGIFVDVLKRTVLMTTYYDDVAATFQALDIQYVTRLRNHVDGESIIMDSKLFTMFTLYEQTKIMNCDLSNGELQSRIVVGDSCLCAWQCAGVLQIFLEEVILQVVSKIGTRENFNVHALVLICPKGIFDSNLEDKVLIHGGSIVVNQVSSIRAYGLEASDENDSIRIIGPTKMLEGFIWDPGPINYS